MKRSKKVLTAAATLLAVAGIFALLNKTRNNYFNIYNVVAKKDPNSDIDWEKI